ncbi:MAG: proline--tRNA ligase, partial [Chloroflexi bacterium]|nr:proline--tRNA ligase [Chloroflexota bacterium]
KANLERAIRRLAESNAADGLPPPSVVDTPGVTSVDALGKLLGLPASAFLKTLLLRTSDEVFAVVLPGDRELNHAKLRKLLDVPEVAFAGDADFAAVGGVPGYVGPVGLKARVIVDASVEPRGYVAGANLKDAHLDNVLAGRDFSDAERADVHDVKAGDRCPLDGGTLTLGRGVEVGNIFAFRTYYADKMNATYLTEDGTRKPFYFGSYGIGVSRSVQTIIETNHDDKGILWPMSVAPYEVHVIGLPMNDGEVRAKAEELVADLERHGVEVLFDDRDESAGVKFADADLIGIPFRATVSKRSLKTGSVELKARASTEAELIDRGIAAERIADHVRRARVPAP